MTVSAACTLSQSMKKTLDRRCWPYLAQIVIKVAFITTSSIAQFSSGCPCRGTATFADSRAQRLVKKINFISTAGSKRTPNPAGWEAYDGSPYTRERGYGWTETSPICYAADGGPDGAISPSVEA